MPEHRISTEQRQFARGLRKEQTSLEGLLWRELRGRRLGK
jgi:very-short-patch-repair endonuclease